MKLKKTYTTPASQTLELKPQGMLCWSEPSGSLFLLIDGDAPAGGNCQSYTFDGESGGVATEWN